MKRTFFLSIILLSCLSITGQNLRPKSIVKDFFSCVNIYASEDDPGMHKKILGMCPSGFRVSDQLVQEHARFSSTSIDLEGYLLLLREHKVEFQLIDIKEVNIKNERSNNNKVVEIKCAVKSKTNLKYSSLHDLVYINPQGQIIAIGDYDTDIRKPENKIELKSFNFSKKDTTGVRDKTYISQAHKGQISYLYCEVDIKSSEKKDIILWSKIIKPDGSLSICSSCKDVPDGYTFSDKVSLPAEQTYHFYTGWGSENGGNWKLGTYRWEIWTREGLLGDGTFEILPPKPTAVDYLEITNIEFVGLDKNEREITSPVKCSDVLYSHRQKIKGIKVKLNYKKLSKDTNIKVTFDINNSNFKYYHENSWDCTLKKNTTQEDINIEYNNMPQKGKIIIELATRGYNGVKSETKTYRYYVILDN